MCKARTTSGERSGLRVSNQLDGKPSKNIPKILVTEPTGHEDLINFLSVYQTIDTKSGKHYHPVGSLCWYGCNRHGEWTGSVILIRNVPIEDLMFKFSQKRKFRMSGFNQTVEFKTLFSREPGYEIYNTEKPELYQARKTKKGKRNHGNKRI